ncbi:hypothetical protein [Mesorhizobium sp. M2D.F.Ca.ET.233.01.1.1]|uniref:hypothetical protein n=1 Tax=Mesorhizobium sp. M2D.F.Ca.ET.233.01.1.1 TaxID=2563943 RepID=UPI001093C320|nr:hypothetical protein [Mesorhizobium sp. M2D.F.Ca.ET.233.01.1.1]TGP14616.1 hypothetical protein EN876_25630 [Mesorhizobium sp. M2D.F.Ca.ET.233.01.1.1]
MIRYIICLVIFSSLSSECFAIDMYTKFHNIDNVLSLSVYTPDGWIVKQAKKPVPMEEDDSISIIGELKSGDDHLSGEIYVIKEEENGRAIRKIISASTKRYGANADQDVTLDRTGGAINKKIRYLSDSRVFIQQIFSFKGYAVAIVIAAPLPVSDVDGGKIFNVLSHTMIGVRG